MKFINIHSIYSLVMPIALSHTKDAIIKKNESIDLNLAFETDWKIANEILKLVNNYRVSIGISELKKDFIYASANAVKHTMQMIKENELNHDNFNERLQFSNQFQMQD